MDVAYIPCSHWGGDLTSERGKIQPLVSEGYLRTKRRGHWHALRAGMNGLGPWSPYFGQGMQASLVPTLEPYQFI